MMEEHFSWWNLPLHFLFETWKVNSAVGLVFTCIAVFSVAVIFEGFRLLSVALNNKFHAIPLVPVCSDLSDLSIANSIEVTDSLEHVRWERTKNHILQTAIHVFKIIASYGLMLAVMTYNAYIAISIVLGATLGYFTFCHKLQHPTNIRTEGMSRATTTCTLPEPSSECLIPGSSTA
uniref:Copper transport protein n=1 Tax=Ciona savignyi TaxID=51511 RepID=H2Y852_CIOSA